MKKPLHAATGTGGAPSTARRARQFEPGRCVNGWMIACDALTYVMCVCMAQLGNSLCVALHRNALRQPYCRLASTARLACRRRAQVVMNACRMTLRARRTGSQRSRARAATCLLHSDMCAGCPHRAGYRQHRSAMPRGPPLRCTRPPLTRRVALNICGSQPQPRPFSSGVCAHALPRPRSR